MYESLSRRGDNLEPAGPRARQKLVDAHVGNRLDFLRRHEEAAKLALTEGGESLDEMLRCLRSRIADTRMLRLAWDKLCMHGGPSPGTDGLTYTDLEDSEVWVLMRLASRAICDGSYQPGPVREVRIPKLHSEGQRRLEINSIADRVVAKSAQLALSPLIDPTFAEFSFGFRPGRTQNQAIAVAFQIASRQGRWVWLQADILDAFDAVPINRMLDVLRKRLRAPEVHELIQTILGRRGRHGIPQGNPLSPLLLNLYLDHMLDRRWKTQQPHVQLIRYADDLLLLCRDANEALAAGNTLAKLAREIGMPLSKQKTRVEHLDSRKGVEWLGYQLRREDGDLTTQISEMGWRNLRNHLEQAHWFAAPPVQAQRILDGWFVQQGPAYDPRTKKAVLDRLHGILSDLYLVEALDAKRVTKMWRKGRDAWHQERQRAANALA
jgi:group II intron reverse transcriptase/maturase